MIIYANLILIITLIIVTTVLELKGKTVDGLWVLIVLWIMFGNFSKGSVF